jgi:SAM-dependent methyltransferase
MFRRGEARPLCAAANSPNGAAPFDEYHCRRAVEARPKSADARRDLAHALAMAGDPAEAVEQCTNALALKPSLNDAARLLASLLQRYALNASIDIAPRGLEAAFAFVNVDRQALTNAAIAYLREQPPLADIVAFGRNEGWDAAAAVLLAQKGRKLLQNRLFQAALTHGLITDVEVEFLLTAFRRHVLLHAESLSARPVYEFVCLFIRQCHNTGFVYHVSEDEQSKLDRLTFDIGSILDGEATRVGNLLLHALYQPLHRLVPSDRTARGFGKVLPRTFRPVLSDHLTARQTDAAFSTNLPHLTEIIDETSRHVAAQYQSDPYPQWLSLQVPESGSAATQMQPHFSRAELDRIAGSCDILIAGAGTCQHAVNSAIAYGPRARVLAIDLSAPSLAYGARMAQTLGVNNIRFATADILRLGELDTRFDVIECSGVLHHMDAPFDAWRILLGLLRPAGLIQIGLYSALSRRVIEDLAHDPDWPGPDADDDALRAFRQNLMRRGPGQPGFELTLSIDFFSKSGFRDLVLHVNEQRCTIPEIRDFVAANDLEFRGFTLPPEFLDAYRIRFPTDDMPGTLDHWSDFEEANPRTFDGMYIFWCRSKANQ